MADRFLDFETGDDGLDGTSFAQRVKTVARAQAVAAAGDRVKIMGSPADSALGNCDFTQGNSSVTIPSNLVKVISQAEATTNWTAASNVTQTTSTTRRQGSNSLSWALAAGFTTGKISTFDLGASTDLSSWRQVCFWIRASVATIVAADLTLKMYSDAGGTTEVASLNLTQPINVANNWFPVVLDNGSALPNNVRSVALVANNDFGAATLLFDCLFVSKAPSAADCLTLHSLVKRDAAGEPWFAIQSVTDTTLVLDCDVNQNAGQERGYPNASASGVATRVRQPIVVTPLASGNFAQLTEPGATGSHMVWSGGWDRTAMSTQDLETWVTGSNGIGNGFNLNGHDYHDVEKLSFVRFSDNWLPQGNFQTFTDCWGVSGSSNNFDMGTTGSHGECSFTGGGAIGAGSQNVTGANGGRSRFKNFLAHCSRSGVGIQASQYDEFDGVKAKGNSSYGWNFAAPDQKLWNCETGQNGTGALFTSVNCGYPRLRNCLLPESTEVGSTSSMVDAYIYSQNHDQVAGAAKQMGSGWNAYNIDNAHSEQADRRTTGAGKECWKVNITNTERNVEFPVFFSLTPQKIYCAANKLRTVKVYVKKNHASNIQAQLILRGGQIAGAASDVTATKADDTSYEELTITFTPTEAGVVEVHLKVWVSTGTTHGVFIDDMTFLQAA